jgi:hypothetical protein
MYSFRAFARVFVAGLLGCALGLGCGGESASNGASMMSTDGGSADGGSRDGAVCPVDPAGTPFTFHVHNGGTTALSLAYGCGADQPIVLTTPAGSLGIGPESASNCGFTCESDYQGNVQTLCTDCGNGVGKDLAAGATVDIVWDRRVYTTHTADPQCVGGQTGVMCSLAVAVASRATQQGTLAVCATAPATSGFCPGNQMMVAFTVDLTKSEGTIEVP